MCLWCMYIRSILKTDKMKRLITLFFVLVTLAVKADQRVVPYGSAWKYLANEIDPGAFPVPPVVTRGAYLQLATTSSIYVRWRTNNNCDSKIYYGTAAGVFTNNAYNASSVTEHALQLTGLTPNTKYYYAVATSTDTLQNNSTENFFVTPPVAGTAKNTRIWVLGDMGTNTAEQNQVRDAYYNYTGSTYTDLMLWLGDNAYSYGTDAEYQNNVFSNHMEKMLKQTVVYPAAGNHDVDGPSASNASTQTGPYYDMFTLPSNAEAGGVASGTEAYYSYNYNNIHFVVLETTTASFRVNGGAMMTWLQSDLAAATQKWKVVYFHHPPYTMGSHNSDTETQHIEVRQNFVPILEQYNVDLVLSGHSHNYERSYFIKNHTGDEASFSAANQVDAGSGAPATPYFKTTSNNYKGTVYAVCGISGVIEGVQTSWPHAAMYSYSFATYGSMVIDVNGDSLSAKLIDNALPNPNIYDQFKIVKQCNLSVSLNPFSNVCSNAASFALTGGAPAGGIYSGNGVSAGNFNPATAGVGVHTITYTYTDGTCTNFATATITVNQSAVITASGSTTICEGTAVTLNAPAGASQ